MTVPYRFLLIFGICSLAYCQSDEDDILHFTNPSHGNAVWIVDDSSLPWSGNYQFLRSLSAPATTLLSVVDSSTGATLGQCVTPTSNDATQNSSKQWGAFHWELTSTGLDCSFNGNPSRSQFAPTANPRTFSVRIQAGNGPACIRQMTVQNEQPVGCPPHLSRNSFTAMTLNCSCPYLDATMDEETEHHEEAENAEGAPAFPLFKGIEADPSQSVSTTAWTLSPSPCATHECLNNGTCLVSQEGTATCLCRNGFTGDRCELDVCSSVPCQNGGVCRSNAGIAYCECPAGFAGLLCESTGEDRAMKCNPECSNGQCVEKNGLSECECRQGFTGSNCNVLDVCLGDAACSMFGSNAKCVLDDNMDSMMSLTLINGTYDCLCPHPVHGQFVDCMQLHAPSSSIGTLPPSTAIPTFPMLEINKPPPATQTQGTVQPTVPTVATPVRQQATHSVEMVTADTVTETPLSQVEITFSTLPPPFNQHLITTGAAQPNPWFNQQPTVMPGQPMHPVITNVPTQRPTTFIFPQTPETTVPTTTTLTQKLIETPVPKFVAPVVRPEEQEEEEDHTTEEDGHDTEDTEEEFPTPSTMHVGPGDVIITSPQPSIVFETTTETIPSTTTESEDYDEDKTTEVTTETPKETSTIFTEPTTTPTIPTTTEEESEEELHETQTTQSTLPFWMTSSTTTTESEEVPATHPTPAPQPVPRPVPSSTESNEVIEASTEESHEHFVQTTSEPPKPVEVSTPTADVVHHTTSNKQSSAAASWIIAIIALIVLGLLLLATSLFILRYIRQSRKLHGKYNPAREEHNLSAAYAMPMSHIAKEERLI